VTDLTESVAVLTAAVAKVGDLSGPEAMLTAQACALDAIFTKLARRAALNMSEHINAAENLSAACSQSAGTMPNHGGDSDPRPVAFVSQANISSGPQQVNNATPPSVHVLARRKFLELPFAAPHLRASSNDYRLAPTSAADGPVRRIPS
jgi:hypothetical protein